MPGFPDKDMRIEYPYGDRDKYGKTEKPFMPLNLEKSKETYTLPNPELIKNLTDSLNSGKMDYKTVKDFIGMTTYNTYEYLTNNFFNKIDEKQLNKMLEKIKKTRFPKADREAIHDTTKKLRDYRSFKEIPDSLEKYDKDKDGLITYEEVEFGEKLDEFAETAIRLNDSDRYMLTCHIDKGLSIRLNDKLLDLLNKSYNKGK